MFHSFCLLHSFIGYSLLLLICYTSNGSRLISLSSISNVGKTISFFFLSFFQTANNCKNVLVQPTQNASPSQFKTIFLLFYLLLLNKHPRIRNSRISSRIRKTVYKVKCKYYDFQLTYW